METKRNFITKSHFFALVTLFIIATSMIANKAGAKNYYVSATGNDSQDGLTTSTPWKTIGKVNTMFSTFAAGDFILFRKNDTFYGSIVLNKSGTSGSPIVIGYYGSGAKPIITGFTTLSGWTDEGGGIYSKVITSEAQTNMVTIDGVQYAMGRYPDATYLSYETFSANTSITDNTLGSATNWTGAEAAIRKDDWTIDRCLITNHTSNTLTYTSLGSTHNATANFGYFIQNDLRTLTTYGEWYHNTGTGKFYMYFGAVNPATKVVKVATLNNLLSGNGNDYITIDQISFTGSIDNTVNFQYNHDFISFQKNDISFSGKFGIIIRSLGTNNVITLNVISHCNNVGIMNSDGVSTTIINNTVSNIGTLVGQQLGTDGGGVGISTYGGVSTVRYNIIRNTGYNGMTVFRQGATTIQYNIIDSVCTVLDDGGGIYTAGPYTTLPRLIDHNIITNVIGNTSGKNNSTQFSVGIYLDETATNVTVTNNTVANSPFAGIKLHKANSNIITDNTTFNNLYGIDFLDYVGNQIRLNSLRRNIFFAKTATQYAVNWHTVTNDISSFGTADSNYYARPIDDNLDFKLYQPSTGDVYKTLAEWQTFSSQDAHSKKSPITVTDVNNIRFEYNPTNAASIVTLDGQYINIGSQIYNGSITLQPYSSAILMKYNKYEAENATLNGGDIGTNHTGYSGTGFWENVTAQGYYVQFTVTAASAGSADITCRYSNAVSGGVTRNMSLYVNGTRIRQVSFPTTGSWDTWADRVDNVTLNAGSNTIKYQYDSGDNGWLNIDYITVSPYVLSENYEAENATLNGGNIGTGYTGYSGTGFWENVTAQGDYVQFAVTAASTGSADVTCRYANYGGTARTMSLYVNNVKIRQVSFPTTGSWNTWADKVDNVTLNAGSNTIKYQYDSGDNGIVNIDYIRMGGTHLKSAKIGTSIEGNELKAAFNADLYPNPATDQLNIRFSSLITVNAFVTITDLNGKAVARFKLGSGSKNAQISIGNIPSGMYLVEINDGVNQLVKKLIINK